jgi:hypothetical protein
VAAINAASLPRAHAQHPAVWRVRYCGQWMYFEDKANAEIYAQGDDNTEPLYTATITPAGVEDVIKEAWEVLEGHGFPPEACSYLPAAIDSAISCMATAREDLIKQRDHALALVENAAWRPIEEAPRDGTWIIARCNDGSTVYRLSWGRARDGHMCWCSSNAVVAYGDGLFSPNGGWIPCPQPGASPEHPSTERQDG